MKLLSVIIVILVLGPCKSEKKGSEKNSEPANIATEKNEWKEEGQAEAVPINDATAEGKTYHLLVSFTSRSSGIDHKAKNQFDEFIKKFESDNNLTIEYEQVISGREGEVDYCFDLSKLSKSKQKTFISKSKALLTAATKQIQIYKECFHKR